MQSVENKKKRLRNTKEAELGSGKMDFQEPGLGRVTVEGMEAYSDVFVLAELLDVGKLSHRHSVSK